MSAPEPVKKTVEEITKTLNVIAEQCLLNEIISSNNSIKVKDNGGETPPTINITVKAEAAESASSVFEFIREGAVFTLNARGGGMLTIQKNEAQKITLIPHPTGTKSVFAIGNDGLPTWLPASGDRVLESNNGSWDWHPVSKCENSCGD